MEDKEYQEQRLKLYTGRSTPAQPSGSREEETQERTGGESTAKKAQQFRPPQEAGQHRKQNSSLVTDPYAELGANE